MLNDQFKTNLHIIYDILLENKFHIKYPYGIVTDKTCIKDDDYLYILNEKNQKIIIIRTIKTTVVLDVFGRKYFPQYSYNITNILCGKLNQCHKYNEILQSEAPLEN